MPQGWTGIKSLVRETADISIYPNPTNSTFTINAENITSIIIFDLLGNKILETKSSQNSIDVSNLASGQYLVRIQTSNGVMNKKIIKE
jgi:hypothetical protein